MKILLTGATGFIGSVLTRKLLAEKHQLGAVVRERSNADKLDQRIKPVVFNGDLESFVEWMGKEKFDGVIHLASLYLAAHQTPDVAELVKSNVQFPAEMLEASVKCGVPWFINTGSFVQHYNNKKYSPFNLYAATKQAFEDIAKYYLETSGINFVTIQLFDTFGPNDPRPKIFSLWSKIAATGESLDMSPGRQIVDINYVENVADGFVKMVELLSSKDGKRFKGRTYSLSSGHRHSLRKLAKIFEQATGKKLRIHWGNKPYRPREVMVPWEKGRNVPGWRPIIPLKEAIQLSVKD